MDMTAGKSSLHSLPPPSLTEQERSDRGLVRVDVWFACRNPERPPDPLIAYHYCCPACLIHAEASGDFVLTDGGTLIKMMVERLNEHGPAPEAIPWRSRG